MRKRIGIIIVSALLVSGLAACGNNTISDNSKAKETHKVENENKSNNIAATALKQGKEALQNKEYSKAMASFDIVLDNDTENKEAAALKSITNDYIAAKKYLEQWEVDKAQNRIEMINSQYTEYPIKDAVNNLKKQIEDALTANKKISGDIEKLTELYNEKKYAEAKNIVSELNKKNLNLKQKEKINNINKQIDDELKKIAANEKAEELKKAEEIKNKKAAKENPIKYFTDKFNNIEIGIKKDLAEWYKGPQSAITAAAGEEYERWDDALNEIYNFLKTHLSERDMSKLQQEQIQWIKDKEKKAKEAADQYKGGTMAPYEYNSSAAKTTKNRCYELVEKYLKLNDNSNTAEDDKSNSFEIEVVNGKEYDANKYDLLVINEYNGSNEKKLSSMKYKNPLYDDSNYLREYKFAVFGTIKNVRLVSLNCGEETGSYEIADEISNTVVTLTTSLPGDMSEDNIVFTDKNSNEHKIIYFDDLSDNPEKGSKIIAEIKK